MQQETEKAKRNCARRTRPRGSIYTRTDSPHIWICYSVNGVKKRENTKQSNQRFAQKLLDRRLGEIAEGRFVSLDVNKTTIRELAEDFLREYRVNGRKSYGHAERRWRRHLQPFFGIYRAIQITSSLLTRYVEARQQAEAENSTINRELSCLRRMFSLGIVATPPKVLRCPTIPHLLERNVRTGFLEPAERDRLAIACAKAGLWLRAMFQLGCDFGWRKSELLNLRVSQVDLADRTVSLNPGETKNGVGRVAVLTDAGYVLIRECVRGKNGEDYVFTRNGRRVRDFRGAWHKATIAAGVAGLLFHDLRRSAVRSMVRSGIPERVAMTVTGHKTRSVFDRYNIVSDGDLREAARKMSQEIPAVTDLGHDSVTVVIPANSGVVN
jgi:integrase